MAGQGRAGLTPGGCDRHGRAVWGQGALQADFAAAYTWLGWCGGCSKTLQLSASAYNMIDARGLMKGAL